MQKRITVRVIPRAKENSIIGTMHDNDIRVRLTAAPTDGEANKQLIKLLNKQWRIPKSCITIVAGTKSRTKIIELEI
ncbi:MAG: DUF167 domain-containing protein [Candidatus Magasanikbacteria bacterium]|nr:DUF167 domain-containing protein [Candidatus Magasanikbacteria bacterium]MBT4071454.1 DUF167 domain-containing protein [Candidatus Magasanikbacteria bacterium]